MEHWSIGSLNGFFFLILYMCNIYVTRQEREYYEINRLLKVFILKVVLISVAFAFKSAERF